MDQKKGSSAFRIAVVIVMILEAIAVSGIILYLSSGEHQQGIYDKGSVLDYNYSQNGKYVLYIGLNDKDTYTQLIPVGEAKKTVNEICARYVDGYTVTEANGGWVDETGTLTEEISLIYTFTDAEEADIISIMDEVLAVLNQNSILVERQDRSYTFYSGN